MVSIGAPPPGGGADWKPLAYTGVQVVDPKDAGLSAARRGSRMTWCRPGGRPWLRGSGWPISRCRAISGRTWARRRIIWRPTGGSSSGASPRLARYFPGLTDPLIGPGARIGAGVQFGGGVCLGASVVVGEGASLKNTVVWDRAAISPRRGVGGLHCGVRGAGKRFRPGPNFGNLNYR